MNILDTGQLNSWVSPLQSLLAGDFSPDPHWVPKAPNLFSRLELLKKNNLPIDSLNVLEKYLDVNSNKKIVDILVLLRPLNFDLSSLYILLSNFNQNIVTFTLTNLKTGLKELEANNLLTLENYGVLCKDVTNVEQANILATTLVTLHNSNLLTENNRELLSHNPTEAENLTRVLIRIDAPYKKLFSKNLPIFETVLLRKYLEFVINKARAAIGSLERESLLTVWQNGDKIRENRVNLNTYIQNLHLKFFKVNVRVLQLDNQEGEFSGVLDDLILLLRSKEHIDFVASLPISVADFNDWFSKWRSMGSPSDTSFIESVKATPSIDQFFSNLKTGGKVKTILLIALAVLVAAVGITLILTTAGVSLPFVLPLIAGVAKLLGATGVTVAGTAAGIG